MDKRQHLWNITNHLSIDSGSEDNLRLQSYYVARCRELEGDAQLPSKVFGPSTMCRHCGSMWSRVNHRVRLTSSERPGKSVEKLIRRNDGAEKRLSRVKETLVKKAKKNRGNKLVVRCSFCSKDTEINLNRPARLKPAGIHASRMSKDTPIPKKRKKRTRDKTAGLIIAGNRNSVGSSITQKSKPKMTNVSKLSAMIAKNVTPSKKSSLHDFIMELS